ncbi:MAG: alpha/beta fold hydrolase [Deltaproteobacteria bacterium]|nr:alpha/beta fold hydrolase [Deltaproteobacteria bacterium]
MPFVEKPGYRIHYQSFGPPEAPPLLLIMGLGMASSAWDALPSRLADRFHVVVFDNRGMGWSSASPGGFRIRDLADDAAWVLDAAGIAQASVFGISMGGMIAQELALRHPGRVAAPSARRRAGRSWPSPGTRRKTASRSFASPRWSSAGTAIAWCPWRTRAGWRA